MVASLFVALIVFVAEIFLAVILTISLVLQLAGRTGHDDPMVVTWLFVILGATLGMLYATRRSIRAINAWTRREASTTPPIASPAKPGPELWDRDLDGGL